VRSLRAGAWSLSAVAPCSDVTRHPCGVRADGTAATSAGSAANTGGAGPKGPALRIGTALTMAGHGLAGGDDQHKAEQQL
jgi:hypothetical protein